MESKVTQSQMILDWMYEHGSITPLDAINELGVMRLASRISDLRKRGWKIKSKMVAVKNRREKICHVKQYWLDEVRYADTSAGE